MRKAVMIAGCFVLGSGALMVSVGALASGLEGSGYLSPARNATELGSICVTFGIGLVVLEAVGVLPRVSAWITGRRESAGMATRAATPASPAAAT